MSSSFPPPPTGSTVPVSLSIHDAPPFGVSLLSFEVTVTGAVLQPGSVSLLSAPLKVEITRLQTETALLNTASAAPGTYNSITVTFANAELTILNNSGGAIGTCANGAVCELKPALSSGSVSFSGPPFPVTISADSPLGLLLDFNLNNSIQNDLSVNPAIGFTLVRPPAGVGELVELKEVKGRVTAKDATNNQFTLQTALGQSLTIKVDNNTRFKDFDEGGCAANNFSCVAVDQTVEVELRLMSAGTLLAKKVELEERENRARANEGDLEGMVVSVDNSLTQFKMVVRNQASESAGVNLGNVVTVTIRSGAGFSFSADGLIVPATASFSRSADLLVGQNVRVRRLAESSGTAITTDRVSLRMSQLTARVASVSSSTFRVNNLPSLFLRASPTITQIDVLASPETEFEKVAGVTALNVGDTVSLRGLLFKTAGIPQLVVKKVRKR